MTVTRRVCVVECMRYYPLRGWSEQLLPLDARSTLSTESGAPLASYKEAEKFLVSAGWKWVAGDWTADPAGPQRDSEGWTYAVDFAQDLMDALGAPAKAMVHFVRWRRMWSDQVYEPRLIVDDLIDEWTCDHADRAEIDRVSGELEAALVARSLSRHSPATVLHDDALNDLKNSLTRTLLASKTREGISYETSLASRLAVYRDLDTTNGNGRNNNTTTTSAWAVPAVSVQQHQRRLAEVRAKFVERHAFASAVIRYLDARNDYHCAKVSCGADCDFAHVHCPSEGCDVVYSKKRAADHLCPFADVSCVDGCGAMVQRREMKHHLATKCGMREVPCPFADLGCQARLTQRDIQDHADQHTQHHLFLAMGRIRRQDALLDALAKKCDDLANAHATDTKRVAAAAAAALGASDKYLADAIAKVDKNAEATVVRKVKAAETHFKADLKMANADLVKKLYVLDDKIKKSDVEYAALRAELRLPPKLRR